MLTPSPPHYFQNAYINTVCGWVGEKLFFSLFCLVGVVLAHPREYSNYSLQPPRIQTALLHLTQHLRSIPPGINPTCLLLSCHLIRSGDVNIIRGTHLES